MSTRPLIAICGTTGVGKSNLAIELALHLSRGTRPDGWRGASIINADAMQVYEGLDVITNKVPETERQGIEHLLMGFKSPGEQYVVGQWVQDALKAIDDTHQKKKIPIVVGGTSYWMQHLIFPNRLAADTTQDTQSVSTQSPPLSQELADAIASLPPDLLALFKELPAHPPSAAADPDAAYDLHTLLAILDPPVAKRWHWRDTRKVLRSLGIINETGRRSSEIISAQTKDPSASRPRFHTLCLWLYAEPAVLEQRLNERVDRMLEQGLLSEIRSLREISAAANRDGLASSSDTGEEKNDYTLGIYQSIGYKEFHDYLSAPEPSEKALNAAVERMKISTRQYAKRQVSWIRNKLLPAAYTANAEETVVPTYLLDATVLGQHWDKNVRDVAIQLTEDFLAKKELPDAFSLSENANKLMRIGEKAVDPTSVLTARQKRICHVCTVDPARPFMVEEGHEEVMKACPLG
ncbi:putative tRNA isopentenyltransferase [Lyophyllum shimeji]|uniref:tRNA isopentenyltransferase n=1 Tax=Lyophyllum shimeji TaxID=47721 RepID=A0A9P3UJ79_LYOSH|nr:putative tRNA isopentenyltransferase [Lyophyllum shimeji]